MARRYPLLIPDGGGGVRRTLERAHPGGGEAAARISAARARAFSFVATMVGVRLAYRLLPARGAPPSLVAPPPSPWWGVGVVIDAAAAAPFPTPKEVS